MGIDGIEIVGQFDPWTDIDVFILRGILGEREGRQAWWRTTDQQTMTVGGRFKVHVGCVVPHRDPYRGAWSPYICAHELPVGDEHVPQSRRRHHGRRYRAPFVAVRRTSRPADAGARAIATVIRSREPVLVENHLLVCLPRDGRLDSCYELRDALMSEATTRWLNQRMRCRHLTVGALRDIPLA